jgi:hypothetical protein
VRIGLQIGEISICKSGTGAKEKMYVFYGEFTRKDLILSTFDGKKWDNQTVDGNGESIQDYKETERRRTASDVSVSNGCAVTKEGLQVFYRDESQGILLGAINKDNKWKYEIVDGDRDSSGRTTGDVAFDLSVLAQKDSVYLLYDSVLSLNTNKDVTSSEMRLAVRDSARSENWSYKTLNEPKFESMVVRFATALSVLNKHVKAAWLETQFYPMTSHTLLIISDLKNQNNLSKVAAPEFGNFGGPLKLESSQAFFSCGRRLCSTDLSQVALLSRTLQVSDIGRIIRYAKTSYLPFATDKRLVLITINYL